MDLAKHIENLVKALEAGQYNVAPSQLTQGSSLQIEDLSTVMQNVTYDDSHIKLQKMFAVRKSRSLLVQFNRQLSYGRFGGTAQLEGAVGDVDVSDYVRAVVPMCFYSEVRRVTLAANLVESFDGIKAEDREADSSALKLAGDIEFDMFGGKANFSNAGVFDGNPLAMAPLPNILGVDVQIRQSDILSTTQDLMFASFGSNKSVVLQQNGSLSQSLLEDMSLRSRLNMGQAKNLMVAPTILTGYNKATALGTGVNSLQRIVLAGSPQDASGADLRRQWVSQNTVEIEDSRFLEGQTSPLRPRIGALSAPVFAVAPAASSSGSLLPTGTFYYLLTASNERSESPGTISASVAVTAGQIVTFTVTGQAGANFYSVYRGVKSNGSDAAFIGRIAASPVGANVTFTDLGNKQPGFSNGYLIQKDTWSTHELMPYSRIKLAITDLSVPEARARFLTLAGMQPRKNVLADNLF